MTKPIILYAGHGHERDDYVASLTRAAAEIEDVTDMAEVRAGMSQRGRDRNLLVEWREEERF